MTPDVAQEFAKWVAVVGMAGVLFGGWQALLWLREQQYEQPEPKRLRVPYEDELKDAWVMSEEEFEYELAKTERALADMADADIQEDGDEGEPVEGEDADIGYRDADLFSREQMQSTRLY